MKSSFKISETMCVRSLSRHRGPENKPPMLVTSLTGYTLSSAHHNLIPASRQGTMENPTPNSSERRQCGDLRTVRSGGLRTVRSEASAPCGSGSPKNAEANLAPHSAEQVFRTVRNEGKLPFSASINFNVHMICHPKQQFFS